MLGRHHNTVARVSYAMRAVLLTSPDSFSTHPSCIVACRRLVLVLVKVRDSKLRCSEPPGTRAQIRPQARLPVFSPNPTSRPGTLGKISPSAAAGCWNQKTGPALLSLSLLCSLWLVRRCVFPNWGIHAHCLLVLQDCGFHHRVWRIARSPWCDKSMSQNTDRTFSCTVLNNARASAVGEQYDDPSVRWRLRTKSVWYSFGPANRRVC